MNFIKSLHSKFLEELFPHGLSEEVCVGRLSLEIDRLYIDIYTKQEPQKFVQKYGRWGEDFNVTVIHLIAVGIKSVNISNWQEPLYSKLNFSQEDSVLTLSFRGKTWSIDLKAQDLAFQKCSTYFDSHS